MIRPVSFTGEPIVAILSRRARMADLPPFLCPACGLEHYRVSAHGLLRPNAVQGRRALCDGCLSGLDAPAEE